MIARRGFIAGLAGLLATPAIVRANALMPVKVLKTEQYGRSIALMALPDLRMIQEMAFLEGMSQQIAGVLWYGDGTHRVVHYDQMYYLEIST